MTDTDYAMAYKLTRAGQHLKTLHRIVKRFLNSNANSIINDAESAPGYLVVKVVSRRSPPRSLSGLIGEILYHQRASLDYMACDLARYNKQPVDDTEFPIFKERDRFRNPVSGNLMPAVKKRMGRLRPDHQAVIEDEQPFQGRHGQPEDDPLWLLYGLSNFDRHQFLHLTSIITNASFHSFTPAETSTRFEQVSVSYGAFESQAEVARFRILGSSEFDVHVQSDVRFDVAFSDEGPGAGRPVIKTLADIHIRVVEIMQRISLLV